MDIYGGPDSPQVTDRWAAPTRYAWYQQNGIIELIADCRASGHNGRAGLDCIYKQLSTVEVDDFVAWAEYLQSLPYVKGDKIGVEGFSFGGTMTAVLVATAPQAFHYGIAGGGVYDWKLYDTHYTERFMSTPEDNPDGYARTRAVDRITSYPARPGDDGSVMLKLTHGTGASTPSTRSAPPSTSWSTPTACTATAATRAPTSRRKTTPSGSST